MIDMIATGLKIKSLINSKFKSSTDFARYFGLTPSAVCAWCRGNKLPSIDNLFYMSDLFGVSVEEIIVRKGK